MFWMASHYLGLEQQDLFVVVLWLYLPLSLSKNFSAALMTYLLHLLSSFLLTPTPSPCCFLMGYLYNYMLSGATPFHFLDELLTVVFQHLSLLTVLIHKKKAAYCRRLLMSYACYFLSSLFQLVSNVIVYGWHFYWDQLKKCWSILFSYYCHRACCNILDAGLCDRRVVLQW